jgi:hypothetical protein
MLDNKNQSNFVFNIQRAIPYENKVSEYDKNCGECAFKKITVTNGKKIIECKTLQEARDYSLNNRHYSIQRGCQYGGEDITLTEIVANNCKLWKEETIETAGIPFNLVLMQVKRHIDLQLAKTIQIKEAVLVRNIGEIGEKYHTEIILQQRPAEKVSTGFSAGVDEESKLKVNSFPDEKAK